MMKPTIVLTRALLLGALTLAASSVLAQEYPDRPLRLMVPFAASGGADIVARVVAERLGKQLGQRVLVDNRPGAGGTIAADFVAKSAPDGYTLLYGTPGAQIVNPYLMKKLPYDPAKDFAPIAQLVVVQKILVVHPGVAAKSVKELIDLAKAHPGKVNFGSAGIGASSHLAGELFGSSAGIQIVHVPYKGTAQALQDLLAGNIQMAIDSISVFAPHLKSGALRALAVTTQERSPLFPELPIMADALPGFEAYSMNYVAARAGTPRPIVERLNSDINTVLKMPDVRERLISMGITPTGGTPEALETMIRSEAEKWKRVIERSGATAE
jgi:tripartite-type tricarboxylate transporter receptor subunit TctC